MRFFRAAAALASALVLLSSVARSQVFVLEAAIESNADPVQGLTATGGDESVLLQWTPSLESDLIGYDVYRLAGSGQFQKLNTTPLEESEYEDSAVGNGTIYVYTVAAVFPLEAGQVSQFAFGFGWKYAMALSGSAPEPPDAPANLVATPGDGEVELAADAVAGADTYNVYRSLTSGSGFTLLADELATPEYTDTTAENGTEYFYYITAVGEGGESDPSDEAGATPLHAPQFISGLAVMLYPPDTDSITDVAGAVSQIVDLQNGHVAAQATGSKQPTTGSATINGLNALSFDGGDTLQIASITLPATMTVFCLANFTSGIVVAEHGPNISTNAGFYISAAGAGPAGINRSGLTELGSDSNWMLGGVTYASVVYYDGTTFKSYRNGGTIRKTATVSKSGDVTAALNIMSRNQASFFVAGLLGCLLIYNRGLTISEMNSVGNWLAAKFGITWNEITA